MKRIEGAYSETMARPLSLDRKISSVGTGRLTCNIGELAEVTRSIASLLTSHGGQGSLGPQVQAIVNQASSSVAMLEAGIHHAGQS